MIEKLGIIVGILATISTGVYFLIKEIRKLQKAYRLRFDRSWLNEGDISGFGAYTHYMYLDISVDKTDGEIAGTVTTRPIDTDEDIEFNLISINGKLLFNRAKVSLTKVSRGKVSELGVARIVLRRKLLYWKLLKGDKVIFPKKAILWSNSNNQFVRPPEWD